MKIHEDTLPVAKVLETECSLFWLKWPAHDLVLVNPTPPLTKLARPCSKLKGRTSNGEKEVGEYFLLQKCDYGSDLQ